MELENALKSFNETLEFSKKLNEVFNKSSRELESYQRTIQNSNTLVQKASKSHEQIKDLNKVLEKQKMKVTQEITSMYGSLLPTDGGSGEYTMEAVTQEMEKERKTLTELQNALTRVKEERKEADLAKKELKLLQVSLPLQINAHSTDKDFKGLIKRPSGTIEVVEYDLSSTDKSLVADDMWSDSN